MNASQVYARAKLLASNAQIATVCEQFEHLVAGNPDAAPTLAAHRVLAEKAPTPQSREMHGALHCLLAQVCDDAPELSIGDAILWAQITRHFVVAGVRQAAAQFAIETEALLAELAKGPRIKPEVEFELPEGDNREIKIGWSELVDGKLHLCVYIKGEREVITSLDRELTATRAALQEKSAECVQLGKQLRELHILSQTRSFTRD